MFAYRIIAASIIAAFVSLSAALAADDTDLRLKTLDDQLKSQAESIGSMKDEIAKLKGRVAPPPPQPSGFFGGSAFTNPYISLVTDVTGYSSNLNNGQLANRGIPGFIASPNAQGQPPAHTNGFDLDYAELGIVSPVDPYFNFYSNIPITEYGISIEEAFFVTTALPVGWQVKAGKFKSNFSRIDGQHPHAWDFKDVALPYQAFLGVEGLGGDKGAQVTYLPAFPVYALFGAEILQGENDVLFGTGKNAPDFPHAFSLFVKTSVEPTDNSTLYFGPSVVFGKASNNTVTNLVTNNASGKNGDGFDGNSSLYDMEFVWKWKPSRGEGFVLQSEYLYLTQDGGLTNANGAADGSLKRGQDGMYVQGVYQLDRWRYGLRYDALQIFANAYQVNGVQQDLGPQPWRTTAMMEFNPSEFTRIRLQYTYDMTARNGQVNNEFFAQFLFTIGAHAAHTF
jgi:hypothetical protein